MRQIVPRIYNIDVSVLSNEILLFNGADSPAEPHHFDAVSGEFLCIFGRCGSNSGTGSSYSTVLAGKILKPKKGNARIETLFFLLLFVI
jgi:hypothetical protein